MDNELTNRRSPIVEKWIKDYLQEEELKINTNDYKWLSFRPNLYDESEEKMIDGKYEIKEDIHTYTNNWNMESIKDNRLNYFDLFIDFDDLKDLQPIEKEVIEEINASVRFSKNKFNIISSRLEYLYNSMDKNNLCKNIGSIDLDSESDKCLLPQNVNSIFEQIMEQISQAEADEESKAGSDEESKAEEDEDETKFKIFQKVLSSNYSDINWEVFVNELKEKYKLQDEEEEEENDEEEEEEIQKKIIY